ncbi:MAG: PD-(D/E)XK nuclease family protein, partial [Candidatus Diapherotrites archaeon]|nr:PD-(D/E)XK nuclease family protein [Candidatus Diapherotrites archaeon]
LTNQVLRIRTSSKAMDFGNDVHRWAEDILKGRQVTEKHQAVENIKKIHNDILSNGFEIAGVEDSVQVRLSDLIDEKTNLLFKGKIDAVYKKEDKYLIVDWKSSKNTSGAAEYRQQLEVYKRMYSLKNDVPVENISVAIGFVALRNTINDGEIKGSFDDKQPGKTSFKTVKKRIDKFLEWQQEPEVFLEELFSKPQDEHLWSALKEEFDLGSK